MSKSIFIYIINRSNLHLINIKCSTKNVTISNVNSLLSANSISRVLAVY